MRIAGEYSFNAGARVVSRKYPILLGEIRVAIAAIDANKCKTKVSKEKTMPGDLLFSPVALNKALKAQLKPRNWTPVRVRCEYSRDFYTPGYKPRALNKGAFREMDFVKEKHGVELQLGKYAFMVYNVAAKMTIFRNLGYIDAGIEIVPVKALADQMSSGVSYFEQFVWDLEQRGVSNIDVPVLILGVDVD
jgi:Restriction endonuclease BglII